MERDQSGRKHHAIMAFTAVGALLPVTSARLPARAVGGARAARRPLTRLGASAGEVPERHYGEPACTFLPGKDEQAECWQTIVDSMPPTSKSAAIARDHLAEMEMEGGDKDWDGLLPDEEWPWERALWWFLGGFGSNKKPPGRAPGL